MLIKSVQGRKQHGTLHRNPFQVNVNEWTFGYLAGQISDPDRMTGKRGLATMTRRPLIHAKTTIICRSFVVCM